MLLPALHREITLLSPAAMPFMPQQRDSNVSGEEGALLPARGCGCAGTAKGAQTAPAHPFLTKRPCTEHLQNWEGGGQWSWGVPHLRPAPSQARPPLCWGSTAA